MMFQQILAYSNLIRNEKAHLTAKNRVEKGGKQAEYKSSLIYIKKNVSYIYNKDHTSQLKRKMQEKKTSHHDFYNLNKQVEINPVLEKAPTKYTA